MKFFAEKKEINNHLLQEYNYDKTQKKFVNALVNYNYDLISYTIFKYFNALKHNKEVYEVGIVSMIDAIEKYEIMGTNDFEEYLVFSIKLGIEKFTSKLKPNFIFEEDNKNLNIGDVWYNKNHNLEETLSTKTMRDSIARKGYKLTISNEFKNKMKK